MRSVNRIFNQSKIQVVRLTNADLGLRVGVGLAAVAAYLTVWSAVRAPEPTPTLLGDTVFVMCSSRSSAWPNVLLALEGGVLLWGVLLCIQQRSYPDLFNDSQAVAVSLYNTAVLGALAIGVSKSALLSSGPTIALFQQLAVLACVLVLVTVLFVSKFIIVRSGSAGGFGAKADNRTYQGSVLDSSKDASSSPAAAAGGAGSNKHSHGAATANGTATVTGAGTTTHGGHALRSALSSGPSSVQMSAQRYAYTQGQGLGQAGGTAASSRLSPMLSGASPPPIGASGVSPVASGAHLSVEGGGHSARVAPMLPPPALAAFSPNQLAVHRLSTGAGGANAQQGRLRAGSSAVSPRSNCNHQAASGSVCPVAPPGGSPTSGSSGGGGGDQASSSAPNGQINPSPSGSPGGSDGARTTVLVTEARLSPAVLSQNWAQSDGSGAALSPGADHGRDHDHDGHGGGGGGGALPNVVLSDSPADSDVSQ